MINVQYVCTYMCIYKIGCVNICECYVLYV